MGEEHHAGRTAGLPALLVVVSGAGGVPEAPPRTPRNHRSAFTAAPPNAAPPLSPTAGSDLAVPIEHKAPLGGGPAHCMSPPDFGWAPRSRPTAASHNPLLGGGEWGAQPHHPLLAPRHPNTAAPRPAPPSPSPRRGGGGCSIGAPPPHPVPPQDAPPDVRAQEFGLQCIATVSRQTLRGGAGPPHPIHPTAVLRAQPCAPPRPTSTPH